MFFGMGKSNDTLLGGLSMISQYSRQLAEMAPKIMAGFHDLDYRQPTGEQLTMRQYQALIILDVYEHLTISELCEKLNLAPSTGTELVNRMLATGYFVKSEEQPDKRKVILSVTSKGQGLLAKRKQAVSARFTEVLRTFTPEEQLEFVSSFERIMTLMEKYQNRK